MEKNDVEKCVNKVITTLSSAISATPGLIIKIAEEDIKTLISHCKEIITKQPILLELEAPINIIGDIHGQFYDLLRLFEFGGYPPKSNYLFLGDYVDRGKQSIETICLLMAYKIKYPENFFLLRGNHECEQINRMYGFYNECQRRYSLKLWKLFTDLFNWLPVAALIDDKIFCVHGGLSPSLEKIDQISDISRPIEIPNQGLVCDLLWADPGGDKGWEENVDRGVSFVFSVEVVKEFIKLNNIDLIVRAHQVVEDGFEFFAGRSVVTVFSAPDYCCEYTNSGAMLIIDKNLKCCFKVLKPLHDETSVKDIKEEIGLKQKEKYYLKEK